MCLSFALTHTYTHRPPATGSGRKQRARNSDRLTEREREHDHYLMRILFLFLLLLLLLLFVYVDLNPFFELRLVARTRFSHAILSPSLSLPYIHSQRQHTLAHTGSNWPSFSLKHLCKFLLFIICLIYLLTPSHTVSVETEKKANKNIERSLRVDRTHTHTRIHRHSHTYNVFYQLRFGFDVRHTTATTKRRRRHERT